MFEGTASAIFVHRLKARAADKEFVATAGSGRAKTTLDSQCNLAGPKAVFVRHAGALTYHGRHV
jgi:hypothetical protein